MSNASLAPEEAAEEKGLAVVRPGPTQIFVDLDGQDAVTRHRKRRRAYLDVFPGSRVVRDDPSHTPPNRHVVIDIGRPVANATERVAIELAFGSDPLRGLLGLRSIEDGRPEDASVFFEAFEKVGA